MLKKTGAAASKIATIIAKLCENSNVLMWIFRQMNFKGKGFITSFITQTPAPDITANCKGIKLKIDFKDDIQKQIYFLAMN